MCIRDRYLHGAKIGVLVAGEGSADELKKVAMQDVYKRQSLVHLSTHFVFG